jgi:PhzF family phenazine biosynthesis protein
MNKITIYQVDAFTDRLFAGNPAAVCILENWLADELMQSIAAENNLAETAFVVSKGDHFEIRWFTPTVEVDLCGHATLASAFVLFNVQKYPQRIIQFHSNRSGSLSVEKSGEMLYLDFPTDTLSTLTADQNAALENCIGIKPLESYKGKTDYIAVIETEHAVQTLKPNLAEIATLKGRGLVVTAKGDQVDFVSRFFAPQSGIDEDPVTGSAHTSLTPIWSEKTGKRNLTARQLSKRGGDLVCEYNGDRCRIGGKARLYLAGEIYID